MSEKPDFEKLLKELMTDSVPKILDIMKLPPPKRNRSYPIDYGGEYITSQSVTVIKTGTIIAGELFGELQFI